MFLVLNMMVATATITTMIVEVLVEGRSETITVVQCRGIEGETMIDPILTTDLMLMTDLTMVLQRTMDTMVSLLIVLDRVVTMVAEITAWVVVVVDMIIVDAHR